MINAEIILDSISPLGSRLTTMKVTCHRFILAEINTHRMFSRNSSSSRALSVNNQIKMIEQDLALPISWVEEQKGMTGDNYLSWPNKNAAVHIWEESARAAVSSAKKLQVLGLHKSLINRILEPYLWHTIVITSTDWTNFWDLRCHKDAQPEMSAVACLMQSEYNNSNPIPLDYHDWYLPFIAPDEQDLSLVKKTHISVARCARTSYRMDGQGIEKDLDLYDRLIDSNPPHLSPFEHVAHPAYDNKYYANFRGWIQKRESMTLDERV